MIPNFQELFSIQLKTESVTKVTRGNLSLALLRPHTLT